MIFQWFTPYLPITNGACPATVWWKKKRPRPAGPRACGSAATFLAAFSSWAVWAVHAMPETQSHINGSQRSYTYVTYINISYHMCIYTYYTHRFWQKWTTYIDYVDINSLCFRRSHSPDRYHGLSHWGLSVHPPPSTFLCITPAIRSIHGSLWDRHMPLYSPQR